MSTSDFYLRYYVGHKGKFGHEFLEFEFRPDGKCNLSGNTDALAVRGSKLTGLARPQRSQRAKFSVWI